MSLLPSSFKQVDLVGTRLLRTAEIYGMGDRSTTLRRMRSITTSVGVVHARPIQQSIILALFPGPREGTRLILYALQTQQLPSSWRVPNVPNCICVSPAPNTAVCADWHSSYCCCMGGGGGGGGGDLPKLPYCFFHSENHSVAT